MGKDNQNVSPDAGETGEVETASAPLEEVTSSDQTGSSENQGQPQDQAGQQSPEVDYLKILDESALDPVVKEQLKMGYLRQVDYTKKTQELAKERGTLEQYREVQPIIEFLGKNPEVLNDIIGKMQGQVQPTEGQEQIPEDPKQYAEWVKANTIKEVLAIQAREADFQAAAKVDPRLDADPEFGEIISRMVAKDPEFVSSQITAEEATRRAVVGFDKYISRAVSSAKNILSDKAKAKKTGSTVPSRPGTIGGKSKASTIEEAAKMAEEELAT
jgi:hypothetical protein